MSELFLKLNEPEHSSCWNEMPLRPDNADAGQAILSNMQVAEPSVPVSALIAEAVLVLAPALWVPILGVQG